MQNMPLKSMNQLWLDLVKGVSSVVVADMVDCSIVISEFKLYLH